LNWLARATPAQARAEQREPETIVELKRHLLALWKWSWLIVLATLLATIASFWVDSRTPRIYRATATLLVGQSLQSSNPQTQDVFASQQLGQTSVQLVRHQFLLQATIDALGLETSWEQLNERISAVPVAGTQLIQISASDTDPGRAKAIADDVAHQLVLQSPSNSEQEPGQQRSFVNQQLDDLRFRIEESESRIRELQSRVSQETSAQRIQELQAEMAAAEQKITVWQGSYARLLDFDRGNRTNFLRLVEPAPLPTRPVSPNTMLNVLLAALIGFGLASAAALLLEALDDTIKTGEDVQRVFGLPTLGTITRIEKPQDAGGQLVALQHPHAPTTEAYRVLRTNVQFSILGESTPMLLVTSAVPGEGKSTTACNLAITMAQAGKRVIVCDTDLRRPSLRQVFNVTTQRGLSSLLLDETLPTESVLVQTAVPNLQLMPSGPLPPNPAELLGSEWMRRRVEEMKSLADVVIFDSPPVLAVADSIILGALCSGVILVIEAGRTRSDACRRCKDTLDQVGLKILGVVLNKVAARQGSSYYYAYSRVGEAAPQPEAR
jgi:succinoglycan biosynthesis transport protein ExoP